MRASVLMLLLSVAWLSCGGAGGGGEAGTDAPDAPETIEADAGVPDSVADGPGDVEADAVALDSMTDPAGDVGADLARPDEGRVYVVLFTHIEDSAPGGTLGSPECRAAYLRLRGKLIEMARLARSYDLPWVLQPDWKILEAARLYEDATTMADTGGKNFLRYLHEDLGVAIDPHSHEHGGYNYTDVAYLLELLGVGGSTVIGGHVWDPSLPEFQEWDRFRVPVHGQRYPEAVWRGDILIGAGTPGHVDDPVVSGVWRPQDRDHFFTDDPAGNIVAVGAWEDEVAGVRALVDRYAAGTVPPDRMLTASWNIRPDVITAPDGLETVEETVIGPVAGMRDEGLIVVTDFTTLVSTWRTAYGGEAFVYGP